MRSMGWLGTREKMRRGGIVLPSKGMQLNDLPTLMADTKSSTKT